MTRYRFQFLGLQQQLLRHVDQLLRHAPQLLRRAKQVTHVVFHVRRVPGPVWLTPLTDPANVRLRVVCRVCHAEQRHDADLCHACRRPLRRTR